MAGNTDAMFSSLKLSSESHVAASLSDDLIAVVPSQQADQLIPR